MSSIHNPKRVDPETGYLPVKQASIRTSKNAIPDGGLKAVPGGFIDLKAVSSPVMYDPSNPTGMLFSNSKGARRGAGGRASIKRYGRQYLNAMQRKYSPLTIAAMERRYVRIDGEMEMLYKQGIVSTVSPTKITAVDIHNFLQYRMNLGLSNAEIIHEISALTNLFDYIGNDAVRDCMNQFPYLRPSVSREPLPGLTSGEVEFIYDAVMQIDFDKWEEVRNHAIPIFALSTGMRPKELRLCNVEDLDCSGTEWKVIVKHPKGEGKYGRQRPVYVDPKAYPFLTLYLQKRKEYVAEHCPLCHAFFPGGQLEGGYFAGNTIRGYVQKVSERLGIDFTIYTCRRTYGQRLLDSGADISTASKMLGHKNTVTTENSYCGLDQMEAYRRAAQTLGRKPTVSEVFSVPGREPEFESKCEALPMQYSDDENRIKGGL